MRDAASMVPRGAQVAVFVVVAALSVGCGGRGGGSSDAGDVVARAGGADAPGAAAAGPTGEARGGLVVDVAGMVRTPGVYELPRGARVHEAIAAAGGVRPGGVLTGLNRAAEVVDGQQVVVPDGRGTEQPHATPTASAAASTSGGALGGSAPVSLNAAGVAALDALPGIGPVTAQRIVDDRTANGPFAGVADLDRVPGIGAGTIADLEGLVTP